MNASTQRPRTRRSYVIQLSFEAAIWLVNLYLIVTRFHTMGFLAATTAAMIFLFAPANMWQAVRGLRRETA